MIKLKWYNEGNNHIYTQELQETEPINIPTNQLSFVRIYSEHYAAVEYFAAGLSDDRRTQRIRNRISQLHDLERSHHHPTISTAFEAINNPSPMPVRATNREWLLAEAKDILEKYKNPHVNWIEVSPAHTDQPEEYKSYGINIVTLNRVRKAQNIPGGFGNWYLNFISYEGRETFDFKGQIPETRNTVDFAGYIIRYSYNTWGEVFQGTVIDLGERNLAFVEDNTIILLWELEERNTSNKHIMRYLLKEALKVIDQNEFQPNAPENLEEYHFTQNIIKFLAGKTRSLKSNLAQAEGVAQNSYQTYIEATKNIQTYKLELINQEATEKDIQEKVRKAIIYFKNHENILKFENTNTNLIIWFKDLSVTYKKETIKLPIIKTVVELQNGKFAATVDDPSVKYKRCHPHIFGPTHNFSACTGNYTTIFPRIVANGDITGIVELLIQFFQSYNDESPAINWIYWRYIVKNNLETLETSQLSEKQVQIAKQEWTDYLDKLKK